MKLALCALVFLACTAGADGVASAFHRYALDEGHPPDIQAPALALANGDAIAAGEVLLRKKLEKTTYTYLLYGGIATALAVVLGGVAFFVARQKRPAEDTTKDAADATDERSSGSTGAPAPSAPSAPPPPISEVNLERFLKLLAKRAAQQVGPKLSKAHKVKSVLETRMSGLRTKVAGFLLDEVYGVVAKVLREVEAEEAMLIFDPAAAAAANLPPASILLAGLLSPIVLSVSLVIHLSQVLLVLIPVLAMCGWALYVDKDTLGKCAVPTLSVWIYWQGGVSLVLLVSHLATTVQIQLGKISIKEKMDSMQDRVVEALSDGELTIMEIRELFLVSAILLEHALVVEDGLRRSIWRTIIGYGTIAWMGMTLWTFVLVLGWTFVPGVVAFHPSAAKVAGDQFCGAWATVFTARLSCVLSLLFLMFNLGSVIQWISDNLVTSEAYSAVVIGQAKKFDDSTGGFPVAQTLVKAFLLRGNGDSIKDQIAQSYNRKYALQQQQKELIGRIDTLQQRIEGHKAEAILLKRAQGIEEDDLDAMGEKMLISGSAAAENAADQAKAIEKKTKEELQVMYEKLREAAARVQQSEVVRSALAQAKEIQEVGVEGNLQRASQAASSGLAAAQDAAAEGLAVAQDSAAVAQGASAAAELLAAVQGAAASAQETAADRIAAAQGAVQGAVSPPKNSFHG